MSMLFPAFLAAGLAIGLPVVLHLLRRKPNVIVPFPTLRFLVNTAIRDTRRHRLMRLLTLLLRCLAILLLAFAFARPFFPDAGGRNSHVMVIAVDNSMSMQAKGRWENHRLRAFSQLDELGNGDRAGVLLMHPVPRWLVPVTGDVEQVKLALNALQPGFESTRYPSALRMAGQALDALPARKKTLVWMADEQRLGWQGMRFGKAEGTLPAGVDLRFADPSPAPKSQAAITSLRWTRIAGKLAVEVKVRLFTPAGQSRHLRVWSGKEMIASRPLVLDGEGEISAVIPLDLQATAAREGLKVMLDADDLSADDTAWLAPVPEAARTILYSPTQGRSPDFLKHALSSLAKLEGNDLGASVYPDGAWPLDSVAIATGDCFVAPLVDRLDRFTAAGGALWIVVDGSPAQARWLSERGVTVNKLAETDGAMHLRDWDLEHPILKVFAGQSLLPLMEVEFGHGFSLEGDGLTPLANWPDGKPGLAGWDRSGQRTFISGFPLDRKVTNWLVQPSFVPFVHQTARWLADLGDARAGWRVGDSIPLPFARGTWRTIESPCPAGDRIVTDPLLADVPGLFEFSDGNTKRVFAVNTPLEESDLTPFADVDQLASLDSDDGRAPEVFRSSLVKSGDDAAESQQRLWWWLLAACGAAMLAELALSNRTAS